MSASKARLARKLNEEQNPTNKKQKKEISARTAAIGVIAVGILLIIAAVAMQTVNSGAPKRNTVAAVVNGEEYNAADTAFYYYNLRGSLIDAGTVSGETPLTEQEYTDSEDYDTWYDYVVDQSLRSLSAVKTIVKAANADNYDGGSEVEEKVNADLASLAETAEENGYDLHTYIGMVFGNLVTYDVIKSNIHDSYLAESYMEARSQGATYTDEQLENLFSSDPNKYSSVDYEVVIFLASSYAPEPEPEDELTDEASDEVAVPDETTGVVDEPDIPDVSSDEAADTEDIDAESEIAEEVVMAGMQEAKEAAEAALEQYKLGTDLETISAEFGAEYTNSTTPYGTDNTILDWLFDDSRISGDVEILDYSDYFGLNSGYALTVFHEKSRPEYHTVSVRHILVDTEEEAQSILDEYLAGDQTEDSFGALAAEYSSDGNAESGGLYEGVYKGQMVKEFEDWCFDESRQTGDTDIVQTDYGYHVMYYVGHADAPFWVQQIAVEDTNNWYTEQTENFDFTLMDGMKYLQD